MSEVFPVPEVAVETALVAVLDGALLLDVREPHEWEAGHAPMAVHIPLGQVVDRLGELPTDRTIFVICRSGRRSERVAGHLIGRGFDAVNVEGGMMAWQTDGISMVDASGGPGAVA